MSTAIHDGIHKSNSIGETFVEFENSDITTLVIDLTSMKYDEKDNVREYILR